MTTNEFKKLNQNSEILHIGRDIKNIGVKRVSQGAFIYNSLMENFKNKLITINKDNSFQSLF